MNSYEQVLVALRRVIRATDLHSKRLSKHAGLTGPQLLIMRTIRDLGEVTIGTIAENVSLSQATVTTILDRLEHRKLVYRVRSTRDKRKVHAHLTEEGARDTGPSPQPAARGLHPEVPESGRMGANHDSGCVAASG